MNTLLFKIGDFASHSGKKLTWKVECDRLTNGDWECLAHIAVVELKIKFFDVFGIPRGGKPLADVLFKYRSSNFCDPILIVDDVYTTGSSFKEFTSKNKEYFQCKRWVGLVAFSRVHSKELPSNIKAIWSLNNN